MDGYADYTFYLNTYGGTSISAAMFQALAKRASYEVERLTLNRAGAVITENTNTALIDRIKMATCAIAEVLNGFAAAGLQPAGIESESVGDYSVKYTSADVAKAREAAAIQAVAEQYLALTGLMFIGVA